MQIAYTENNKWLNAYSRAWKFIDLLYPPHCFHCGEFGSRVCSPCWESKELFDQSICSSCGSPNCDMDICPICSLESPTISKTRSLGNYDGILRSFIVSIKYERNIGLAESILHEMETLYLRNDFNNDLIIPVPLGKKRRKTRGYNQVSQWGKLLAKKLNIDFCETGLIRVRNTASQVSLPADQRRKNVKNAFQAVERKVKNKRILLLDDVITTGATLNECAETLLNAGVKDVQAMTIARASSQIK